MTEDSGSEGRDLATVLAERRIGLTQWAIGLGVVLACVGVADGIIMATKRKVADCPDGTFFPEGETDFTCYAHPQGGLGLAIVVISVLLGLLVAFAGSLVVTTMRGQQRAQRTG